ncbi:hypothetical protein [Flavobacterium sp. UBA7663]|uniref:hypothetical protein n=1 Tax=Flavobacterium sp. UBA7663 TaxID=1946557 RepID=UPI0025BC0847|nr:hypothetical protein [Flavobacterium sp. UBA7663]
MGEAVVLVSGKVVKKNSVSDTNVIIYNNNGTVKKFFNKVLYICVSDSIEDGVNLGNPIYVMESEYNKLEQKALIEKKGPFRKDIPQDAIYNAFIPAAVGDIIHLPVREKIVQTQNTYKFCTGIFSWSFNGNHFSNYSSVIAPSNANSTSETNCQIISNDYQNFINKHGNRIISGGEQIDINIVADIAEILTKFKNDDPDFYTLLTNRNLLPAFNNQTVLFSQDIDLDFYFYGNDDYKEYRNYLIRYKQWFDLQREKIMQASESEQMFLLISMFNEKELEVIDVEKKVLFLHEFSNVMLDDSYWLTTMPYRRESVVIKLIKSITSPQADRFLDELLLPSMGVTHNESLFKILYDKLDDNRIKRYPLVPDLGIYKDNKKRYINALTKIWKYSKYYPQYTDNNGITQIKDNCYFFNQGLHYFVNSNFEPVTDKTLEFARIEGEMYVDNGFRLRKDYRNVYKAKDGIVNNKITITKTTHYTTGYYSYSVDNPQLPPNYIGSGDAGESKIDLTYHIYQPISLSHYTSDLDLKIPEKAIIPAFLFYYAEDYDKLKDLDAKYSFAIEVGIEIILFAVSGGGSSVRQLLYLRKLSNFGRAADATITTGNVIIKWQTATNVLNTASLGAGIISAEYAFLASTTNNQADFEKYQTQRTVFGFLALGTGVASIFTNFKVIKNCKKLSLEIDAHTAAGTTYRIDPAIKTIVNSIADTSVMFATFRNKLHTEFGLALDSPLITKFDDFTDVQKTDFYFDFQNRSKSFFQDINSINAIDNWNTLRFLKVPERIELTLLKNTDLVSSYQKFFSNAATKPTIEIVAVTKRKKFLQIFIDIDTPNFTKFENDPSLINKWLKYGDDNAYIHLENGVTKHHFIELGQTEMIKWCEHYGILPPHLINELKAKPLTFRNWNNLNEADKLLLKNIPDEWIPSVYQFQDFCFIRKFCPVEIPHIAEILPDLNKNGYLQFRFVWTDTNGFKISARVHQPIPGSPYFNDGQIWVINRKKSGSPNGSIQKIEEIYLNDGTWFKFEDKTNLLGSDNWKGLINRQKKIPPIITPTEQEILTKGHFKAK